MSKKFFNVAGPCSLGKHYMLDPLRNIGKGLTNLIEQEHYFVIHAARQSGKTTLLKELVRKINVENKYYALYCSLEAGQEFSEPTVGIPVVVKSIKAALSDYGMPGNFAENADYSDVANVLRTSLTAYCRTLDKPLIIFFDEADCLSNGALITFLRQLRNGFINRPDVPFVHSVALVGMRNIRDYKASIRPESATLGSASPFNIVTENFTLNNFTKEEDNRSGMLEHFLHSSHGYRKYRTYSRASG
ncbi:MAG: ATP-binding protein [Fibromonadales bacterium]|nr:ATP-binding protein [Fibromonadales bacterium]